MSNNIKRSMENITVSDEARDRMYENIMKKASAEKKKPIMMYRTIGLAAACIAVICAAAALGISNTDNISVPDTTETSSETAHTVTQAPSVGEMAVSPFTEDYTIDDIKAAGLDITLPEGAEVIFCNIWEDGQLDVRFNLNGHKYYYSAAEYEGDFSGIYDTVSESEDIPDTNAVLDTTSDGYFKSRWSGEKYYYCFSNTDGADKDDMISLIKHFTSQVQ